MKALAAFLIEAACFAGILYFYLQNRKKEQAGKEAERKTEQRETDDEE